MAVTKYSSSETTATDASQAVVEEKPKQTQQTPVVHAADSQVRSSSIIMNPYGSTSTFLSSSSDSCSSTACCDDTESERSTSSTNESISMSSADNDAENVTSSPPTTTVSCSDNITNDTETAATTTTAIITNDDSLPPSKVRFSTIEIREHNMTMGDNPSVSSGIPVTIEWDHANEFVCDLDVYEKLRPERRGRYELVLPRSHRTNLCYQSAGYSRSEIMKQVKAVSVMKNERRRSLQLQRLDGFHEFVEKSCRATMNLTLRKKTKQEEREYIANAMVHTQTMTFSTRRSSV